MNDRAYDVASLADKWRCSKRAIYRMIADGELRAFKLGKKRGLRVSAEEVARWQREREEQSIAQETAASGGVETGLSPASQMRLLASVRG